ncbi:MAG: SHOCT domain-containing protein [Chloroflexi bacterium]|nr:SHOCT domain-containing protein [Chloroflexota bacterium]
MADEPGRWMDELERQLRESMRQLRSMFEEGAAHARGFASSRHTETRDPLDALQQLKKMRDQDLITEDEYQQKKTEILTRL